MSDLSRTFATISAAVETLSSRQLTRISIILMLLSPMIGISSVSDLDMLYTAWTLAGGIAGTGIAFAWRVDGELSRVIVGRATFALVSGMAIPPLTTHYFPWLADLTRNPILLFALGGLSALAGFLFGYAVFHIAQKRQNRISNEIVNRLAGRDPEDK